MTKAAAFFMTLLMLGFAGLAFARQDSAKAKITGWVVDEKCGARVANQHGADCAKKCVQQGQPVPGSPQRVAHLSRSVGSSVASQTRNGPKHRIVFERGDVPRRLRA